MNFVFDNYVFALLTNYAWRQFKPVETTPYRPDQTLAKNLRQASLNTLRLLIKVSYGILEAGPLCYEQ